jgi:hypothetical protein
MFCVRELGFVGADFVLFSVYQLFPQTQYLNVEVDVVSIEDFVIFLVILVILVILVVKFVLVLVRIRTNKVEGFGVRVVSFSGTQYGHPRHLPTRRGD